jgi:hypothetical protein
VILFDKVLFKSIEIRNVYAITYELPQYTDGERPQVGIYCDNSSNHFRIKISDEEQFKSDNKEVTEILIDQEYNRVVKYLCEQGYYHYSSRYTIMK